MHTDPSGTIVASKRFEGQAETEQEPYADDYFFYRYDIRGSVTNIVDGAGSVVKSYDYDEFGVTTSTGDTFFNEVTFTGSVADASGLLYMNARYYNPATARFLSQDTYTGSASDPWTQHLYAYCNNNPVNMVDPTGHMPKGIRLPISIPMKPLFDEEQSKEIVRTAAVAISIAEALAEYDLYQSADEAAIAVAPELYDLTYKSGLEYKANIYSLNYGGQKLYFTGMVMQGEHNNVVLPMISSTLAGSFLNIIGGGAIQNEGFIHTHPYCTRHMYGVFSGFIGDEGAALLAGRCYMLDPKDHVLYRITAEDVIRAALNGEDIAANMRNYKVTKIYDLEPYSDRFDCRKGDKR